VVTTRKICAIGAIVCNAGLPFLTIAFVFQLLNEFFYTVANNRLAWLGAACVLTLVLGRVLRATARHAEHGSGVEVMGYPPLMVPANARGRRASSVVGRADQ
jgi:hypothetical protein